MSRSYAVRSMVGLVVFKKRNFFSRDRTIGPPEFSAPKIFFNEPDEVPISRPLSSNSFSVLISL